MWSACLNFEFGPTIAKTKPALVVFIRPTSVQNWNQLGQKLSAIFANRQWKTESVPWGLSMAPGKLFSRNSGFGAPDMGSIIGGRQDTHQYSRWIYPSEAELQTMIQYPAQLDFEAARQELNDEVLLEKAQSIKNTKDKIIEFTIIGGDVPETLSHLLQMQEHELYTDKEYSTKLNQLLLYLQA